MADTFTLTAGDGFGEHSFDAAGHWNSGAAPSAGNNYLTGAYILRTPTSGATLTFAGSSLTLSPGGALYAKVTPTVITINVLTNTGRIDNAQGGAFTLLGNMYVPTNGGAMDTGSGNSSTTDNRMITNGMAISGSGILTNYTSDANWSSKYPQAQGLVVYTGNNTAFTGQLLVINNTVIQAGSQANLGGNPATFNPAQLTLNNGILRPSASFSLNNPNGGFTVDTNSGYLDIASGIFLTNATALAGSGTLYLTNAGTFVQAGVASNFTGNLAVNGGTLALAAGGSLAGSNTITIGSGGTLDASAAGMTVSGGQTLAGVGTILGGLTVANGGQLSPAGSGAAGTLPVASLTLNNNARLVFDFTGTTNDVIAVSGNLALSGVSKIQLNTVPTANGVYTLMTYGGTLSGTLANLQLAALSTRTKNFTLSFDTASTPKRLLLTVSGSGTAGNLAWKGDGANNLWDINASANWLNGANSDVYYDADNVNFTDAGSGNQPVLNVTVNPGAVNFNSSAPYTLTGTGCIAGATALTKSGTGTATISITNTYSGGTVITGGVLQIGTNNALGNPGGATPLASISGTGTLDINSFALDASSFAGYTNAIQINGNGSSPTQGAIDCSTGGTKLSSGGGDVGVNNLVLLGDSTVSASGGNWQIGNAGPGIRGNAHTLTKIGNSYLYLKQAAVNPLTNLVIAQGGVLFFDRTDCLGATANITLTNSGFIDTWAPDAGYGLTFYNPVVVSDAVNGGKILNFRQVTYNHPHYDIFNGPIVLNGPLTFSNVSYFNGSPYNMDLFGHITVNGAISGPGSVIVLGATLHYLQNAIQGGNLVVFNGNNSYTGPTLVTNLIQLQISTANQSGGAYDVVDYATLDVARAPGKPTMPMKTLILESVNNGPGNLSFSRLSSLSSSPVIYVTNLVVNAGTIIPPVAGYSVGQFPLVKYEGAMGGSGFAGLTLASLPAGVNATLVNNTANHTIDLNVTSVGIIWKGNNSTAWDISSTPNWFNPNTSGSESYQDGETVVFDDTATRYVVDIASMISPQGITVNAAHDYTFNGLSISNGAALIKNGAGTLTITCSNNVFTGGTYINGGTIKLGDTNYVYPYGGAALNNNLGNVTIANGGTLDVNAIQVPNYQSYAPEGYNVFASGAGVNGAGALINSSTNNDDNADPGYVTLVGDTTVGGIGTINVRHGVSPQLSSQSGDYTLTKVGSGAFRIRYVTTVSTNFGTIKILQGIVSYESSSAFGLGDPSKAILVGSNGGFAWGTASAPCVRPLICSNGATLYGYNITTNVFNSPVTLVSGNINLNANYYEGMIFSNVLSGAGGVTLLYQGYATFAAPNTYSGNTTVANSGQGTGSILRLVGNGSINSSAYITLQGIVTNATYTNALAGALDASGRVDGALSLTSGQTLRGDNGSYVAGNVIAGSGSTITPGGPTNIQYMTCSNSLTMQAGSTVAMDVSLDGGTATNDLIKVVGTANYGGTLQLSNAGTSPLTNGASFKLFSAGSYSGNFASLSGSPGGGLAWAFNPASGVASVVGSVASYPTNVTCLFSNMQVTLSWPATHKGWILQSQTNSQGKGLSTNWVDVGGSGQTNLAIMAVNPANGSVFYRLRHP